MSSQESNHPCLTCGACCAAFRVSFYWAESDDAAGGPVPAELTMPVNSHLVCMRGTESQPVRCIALVGKVGERVSCGIYEHRSSTCREFAPASDNCARARAKYGLPPLTGY